MKEIGAYPLINFVVPEGIKNGKAYLNDPAMGRRTVSWDDFRTSYTGIALYIEPTENFKKEGERYNIFKAVAEKLMDDNKAALFILLLNLGMIIPGLASTVFILTRKHPD